MVGTASAGWWGQFHSYPGVMGILNVTPDSFSDGGAYVGPAHAIAAGYEMAASGAAIIDIGGESTRPGAPLIAPADEQARILPVLNGLRDVGIPLSIDTRNASTMAAALDAGATVVNDVSGLTHDPAAAALVAAQGCPVVLMHMRGTPAIMTALAQYDDPVADVVRELGYRIAAAQAIGVSLDRIAVDPGIGFAKDAAHNLAILRGLPALAALDCMILVGLSRKRFIGLLSEAASGRDRDAGSLAAGLFALSQGARVLRVHDVASTVRAVRVWQALTG